MCIRDSVFIGLFVGSLFVIPTLDVQLCPPVERDQYLINMTIKDVSTTEETYNKALDCLLYTSFYLKCISFFTSKILLFISYV